MKGGNITVITDHQSLSTLNTKMEQPARIVRFLDTIEHYNVKIIYRKGKATVLADYLSRPPDHTYQNFPAKEDEEEGNENSSLTSDNNLELEKIKFPHQLNRIDLQCIFEFLSQNENLPDNLDDEWVRKNFGILNNKLHLIKINKQNNIGDPPEPAGVAIFLEVLEYEDLVKTLEKVHISLGHASIGTTIRQASMRYWHPELMLATHEVIRNCRSCQLKKPPDPSLGK